MIGVYYRIEQEAHFDQVEKEFFFAARRKTIFSLADL
jgi:hypothetical protein